MDYLRGPQRNMSGDLKNIQKTDNENEKNCIARCFSFGFSGVFQKIWSILTDLIEKHDFDFLGFF